MQTKAQHPLSPELSKSKRTPNYRREENKVGKKGKKRKGRPVVALLFEITKKKRIKRIQKAFGQKNEMK